MALPINSFREKRYFRSKFREGKFLLAAEATDLQLESYEQLRSYILNTYGNIAVGPAWRPDEIDANHIVLRPGEAWNNGLPFILRSGTDSNVISGTLPTGITMADLSATPSDMGGKRLTLTGSLVNGNYSIVLEISEEIVKETGSGAVDAFLEGVNVGEGTENKIRFVHKVHVVKTSDLNSTPVYPLSGSGITNHFVNDITVTPTLTENFLISAVDITPDINGADRRIVLDNSAGNLPFSVDATDFIFGKLIDSDGNTFIITSLITTDGGATVQLLLDREVDVNTNVPKAGLPVITNNVNYKLVKRDHYVTTTTGVPAGRSYYRISDFVYNAGSITSLTDLRIVTEVNTFGTDPNVRLVNGGEISWDLALTTLTHSQDFQISLPGLSALAQVPTPPGSISFPNDGDVAYILLDREATVDYDIVATVVPKSDVPSNVDVYIFAERRADRIYFPHNGSIGDGETGILGAFGATFDKDASLDLLTDALTENQMDDIFADTFDNQTFVDLTELNSMTFEPFLKQFRAGSSARFIDYDANTLPSADPDNPWTNLGAQTESVSSGILTLTDASIGDQIAYRRTESNLTPVSHNENEFRMRLTAGTGTNPFTYEVRDGTSGKHFGLAITTTLAKLIDGSGATLQSFVLDGTIYHTYKLVKIGSKKVQWYVDDDLKGVYDYATIATGSGGNSDITWGTSILSTASCDIDYLDSNIYISIFQSKDVFRQAGVFYTANTTPDTDPDNVWTLVDGGGGITAATNNSILTLTDATAANSISYYRDESILTRHGRAEVEMRVNINSAGLASFDQFGLRLEDGKKDIAAFIRDDAGTLKVGLYDATSNTLRSAEQVIDMDKFSVIKIVKKLDNTVLLYVDANLIDQVSYAAFTDTSSNKRISFGSFVTAAEYVSEIDYVQYALPGQTPLSSSPVNEFLTIVNGSDPLPRVWVSTDDGNSWYPSEEGEALITGDLQKSGANIVVRIALSTINSTLTDYGILYNRTPFSDVLDIEATINFRYHGTNTDYTTHGETIIGVLDTSALRTITLSTLDTVQGRVIYVKDESGAASGNNITITVEGTQLIDGVSSILITADYGVVRLYSNGVNWFSL